MPARSCALSPASALRLTGEALQAMTVHKTRAGRPIPAFSAWAPIPLPVPWALQPCSPAQGNQSLLRVLGNSLYLPPRQPQASGIPGFPYTLPALFTYAYRWDSARGGVCAAACTHRWN